MNILEIKLRKQFYLKQYQNKLYEQIKQQAEKDLQ